MNILLVSHRFLHHSAGGTEVLTRDVAVALRERGHQAIWLAVGPNSSALTERVILEEGVEAWCIPPVFPPTYPVGWRAAEAAQAEHVATCLERFRVGRTIHAVHCFHIARIGLAYLDHPDLAAATRVATLTDYAVVCADFQLRHGLSGAICSGDVSANTCIACIGQDPGRTDSAVDLAAWRRRNRDVLSRFDAVFTQTPHQRQLLERLGFAQNLFRSDRAAYRLPWAESLQLRSARRVFRFGFVGRASEEKGIAEAALAYAHLRGRMGSGAATLRMITSDPDSARRLAGENASQPGLEWHGQVAHAEIGQVLADLDALLIPSLWLENHPTILTYALSAGLPVLCSDLPSLAHLKGQTGLYFAPSGDAVAWSAQMAKLAAKKQDHAAGGAGLPAFHDLVCQIEDAYGVERAEE
jgi:glycosyltransferase involved in cell wall biosynthesis